MPVSDTTVSPHSFVYSSFSKTFVTFTTKYGSIDRTFVPLGEKEAITVPDGIAHFLEHKMFDQPDGSNVFDKFSALGGNASAFTSFNSIMLGWMRDTKRVYDGTLYNVFIGTTQTSSGKQVVSVDLGTGSGHPLYNLSGVEKEQMEAMLIAQALADLMVEMGDYSREFNDYANLRSYAEEAIKVVWNSKYVNKIRKIDLPTIFHKDGLMDKFEEEVLPARYFGRAVAASDIGEGKMQFDMVKGSFLPPIGKGEYADICFTRLEREDLGIGTNFNGRTALAYRDSMVVKFLGEGNGLIEIPSKKTAGIKIRTAPLGGYKTDYLVTKGKDKSVKRFSSSNPDRNFAFRIRTKRDKNGKVVSAYYGKIYGDIEIKKPYTVEVSVAAPSFLYYLNPTSLDRNLEWDMRTNLCPEPGVINPPREP